MLKNENKFVCSYIDKNECQNDHRQYPKKSLMIEKLWSCILDFKSDMSESC